MVNTTDNAYASGHGDALRSADTGLESSENQGHAGSGVFDTLNLMKEGAVKIWSPVVHETALFGEGFVDGLVMTPINGAIALTTGVEDVLHFPNQHEEYNSVAGGLGIGAGALTGAALCLEYGASTMATFEASGAESVPFLLRAKLVASAIGWGFTSAAGLSSTEDAVRYGQD
jgi:hypothetical protein